MYGNISDVTEMNGVIPLLVKSLLHVISDKVIVYRHFCKTREFQDFTLIFSISGRLASCFVVRVKCGLLILTVICLFRKIVHAINTVYALNVSI